MTISDFFSSPVPIDTRWLTDEQIERLGGGVIPVRFSPAEKRVLKKKKKIRPSVWENPHDRPNHAWDCATLLLLAHEVLGVAFWPVPEKNDVQKKPEFKTDQEERVTPRRMSYERPGWLR